MQLVFLAKKAATSSLKANQMRFQKFQPITYSMSSH